MIHVEISALFLLYWKQIIFCSRIFSGASGVQTVFMAAAAFTKLENNDLKGGDFWLKKSWLIGEKTTTNNS